MLTSASLLCLISAFFTFCSEHPSRSKGHTSEHGCSSLSPKFSLPLSYDKSYRIAFSVVTEDLSYKLRRLHERREDSGKHSEWPASVQSRSKSVCVLVPLCNVHLPSLV